MIPIRVRLGESLRHKLFPLGLAFLERAEELIAGQSVPAVAASFISTPKSVLILLFGRGGGADTQALADTDRLAKDGYKVSVLAFQVLRRRFVLYPEALKGKKEYFYVPFGLASLWKRLDDLSLSEVRVHHLRYWPYYATRVLPAYFATRRIAVTFHLHDFYYICPRVHLVNGDYEFCGVPKDPAECDACIKKAGHIVNLQGSVADWRDQNLTLLQTAKNILSPSRDTAEHYHKIFPHLMITLPPDEILPVGTTVVRRQRGTKLNIAVVGNLLRHKGADVVLAAVKYVKTHPLPFTITVIGDSVYAPELATQGITVTGAYKHAELPHILAEREIDYVWLASTCPETYSMVLDEAWKAGLPVIAFDLGAPAEKIGRRNNGADVIVPRNLMRDIPALCNYLATFFAGP